MKKQLLGLASVILMTACSQTPVPSQIRKSGPGSAENMGVVVTGVDRTALDSWVADHTQTSIRYINPAHGVYELYDANVSELKNEFPEATIVDNKFFKPQSKVKTHSLDQLHTLNFSSSLKLTADDGNPFTACVDSPKAPIAQIDVIYESDDLTDGTVEMHDVIGLTAVNTQAVNKDELRLGWMVYRPNGTLVPQGGVLGLEFELNFDMMGEHVVVLFVQDNKDACSMAQFGIGVTGNREFTRLKTPVQTVVNSFDLSQFYHLDMLNIADAWNVAQGDHVVVAIIDSGVNYLHPALNPNILVNEKEIPGNNIDDDSNGFIDDVVGYDFLYSDAYPYDDTGHGSHVAGTTASVAFGVAPNSYILPIKALSSAGGDLGSIIGAIYYAADRGADVINMSYGGYVDAHPLAIEALKYAENKGIVIVAASGNGHPETGIGLNIDMMPFTPATIDLDTMITVASTGDGQTLATYSNFGRSNVDVVAPGGQMPELGILSAYMENPQNILIVPMQGTSMATPVVSGVAALALSANPNLTSMDVKEILMTSGINIPHFKQVTVSGQLVNAAGAVNMAIQGPVGPMGGIQLPLFSSAMSSSSRTQASSK